ncbi:GbsR/MarR family transcriptional regulator [Nonomuraea typhae]|uniref:GbsR/MarR family transcriptional regulator n=1 Tax=Nonomuraea typhae TaxID=2603600 RepID=UPI0012F85B55|nr:MarR family transcriptional regulator [Nonomuraea typhae]
MTTPEQLAFTDRMAHFYAREYGFPPVAGRVLGYLLICRPPQQSIAELAEALMASRSAVTGAVALLADHRAVRRSRSAGQRMDHVTVDSRALDPTGFAAEIYQQQAVLAREALALLDDGDSERQAILAEAAAYHDFLADRMAALLAEWQSKREELGFPQKG